VRYRRAIERPRLNQEVGAADVAHLLIRLERTVTHRLAAICRAEGCTVDGWQALRLLADGRGHAMSELIAHTLLPPATVTRLLDGMVASSLAYRRVDEADRRRVLVFATERGHELHTRLGARIEEQRSALLGREELDALGSVAAMSA